MVDVTCVRCGKLKEMMAHGKCKSCYLHDYNMDNKERLRKHHRDRYLEHREEVIKKNRIWAIQNRDRVKENFKRWRTKKKMQKNKQKIINIISMFKKNKISSNNNDEVYSGIPQYTTIDETYKARGDL